MSKSVISGVNIACSPPVMPNKYPISNAVWFLRQIPIIAEIKTESPSACIIFEDYDPVNIAKKYYENKATCLSVLTEEDFFQGNLVHMYKIKQKINLPI